MNFRRVWAVARKEFIHILRDPRSLLMGLAIPVLLMMLFGYALTLDVDRVPLAVWDQSGTPASRELLSQFFGSRYFARAVDVDNYPAIERAIDERRALCALIIPSDFADRLAAHRPTNAQFLVDGSDANTASIASGYAEIIGLSYSSDLTVETFRRAGRPAPLKPIDLRPRIWYNPDMQSRNYIIPGLIAVIMMVIAALLTSLTVAREWEHGTMEQLISTPLRGPELIVGKLLPYFGIGMLDVTMAVLLGQFVFAVPLRGNAALVFLLASIFLVGALGLGLLISIVSKNQMIANQIAMVVTFLPAFLLSGFVYSISNMPVFLKYLTLLVPARYFIALLRGVYLKGVGLGILGGETLLLTAFAAAMVLLAKRKFRKKLE